MITGTARQPASARPAKRLLVLCQTLPYPPDGGVEIRTYNVLRLLAQRFDLRILCFFRRAARGRSEQVQAAREALSRLGPTDVFAIPQEHSRLRLARDHFQSLLTQRVYTVRAYESAAFRERLRALRQEIRFDAAYLDSLDLSGYLDELDGLPVICTHHNVESELLRRRATAESNPVARAYIGVQARLMEREERRESPRMALNIAVSEADAAQLRMISPGARFAVVPNGVDTRVFKPARTEAGGIVFVGGHSWYPNADGMEYFSREILPLIRARRPGIAVTWVGRAPERVRHDFAERGVQLTGYVEDIRPYVDSAACFVVPLRVGGGSRLKILDAWALGKAVVSTTVGCEGLDARDGDNILIRDEPAAFADAVERVLVDGELRARLATAARQTAERVYDWDVIGTLLNREVERAIDGAARH